MSILGNIAEKRDMERRRQEGLAASKIDLANAIVSGDNNKSALSMEFAGSTGLFSPEELQGLAVSRANLQAPMPQLSDREYADMMRAIARNRQYNADNRVDKPYMPSASDAEFYAAKGIDVMKRYGDQLDEYNMANFNARQYEKGIDQEVADKWRNSYK